MKILLAGGGTMGPVTPLIAVWEKIKEHQPEAECLFVGTKTGPEKAAVESYKIPFQAICSGKLRRYWSIQNFVDPFRIKIGFFQSLRILFKFKPQVVILAGGYVGVPVAYAAWLLKIPILVHQQDIKTGLANRLVAGLAKKITVSFEPSLKMFPASKVVLTGNPVRSEFYVCDANRGRQLFNLKPNLPVLLVMGGGTGSAKINQVVQQSLAELLQFCQVIHITGKGKRIDVKAEHYQQHEFIHHGLTEAMCAADVVVSRAGLGTLSELSVLTKPTILIPIPDNQQEENAQYYQKNNAVEVLAQTSLTHQIFTSSVKELMYSQAQKEDLARNIGKVMQNNGAELVAQEAMSLIRK